MRLKGKVAIITGAGSGMGAEKVRMFAREGASVVIADILEEEGKTVETEIAEPGGTAMSIPTDVTREEDWKRTVRETVSTYGRLDILVNNTGLSSSAVADPTDTEGWRRIMDVNATGVFLGTKHAVPEMKRAGGRLDSEHPAYHASKGPFASSPRRRRSSTGPTAFARTRSTQGSCRPCGAPGVATRKGERRWRG